MALTIGSRLGPYEITALLGAGGMGEVYRARDTRLGRDVALKILPDLFASDGERLARFTREAQILASLNHPHVAAIFGVEEALSPGPGQTRPSALVLELVDGPTLADRIREGPLPVDEALAIARQIADALEAAHGQGVIHRDLKPANVKVRPDGTVKVLDFGLAKAIEPAAPSDSALSPTITSPAMTRAGVVLGTAAYMSPEQARGRPIDSRTDIWSFGCVLYEMLTATRAFDGDDVSDSIAAVLRSEPAWSTLPQALPPSAVHVLKRCLEKDPRRRLRDMADVRILLDDAPSTAAPALRQSAKRPRTAALVAGAAACLLAGAGAMWLVVGSVSNTPRLRVERFVIDTPAEATFTTEFPGPNLAVSPDGSQIVYHVRTGTAVQLARRRLDRLEPELIPGTERAAHPVFSPTGTELAFLSQGKLQKMTLGGSSLATICSIARDFGGASWGDNDVIVFAEMGKGLFRVPAAGGTPELIAAPDAKKGERDYFSPQLLPEGLAVLFTVIPIEGTINQARIVARRLATKETVTLVEGATSATYASSGHLVYVDPRSGLMAVAFDPRTFETMGTPVEVQPGVLPKGAASEGGRANYSVGPDGSLVYSLGGLGAEQRRLIWLSRSGQPVGRVADERLDFPRYPRLSRDGTRLAATLGRGNEGQIWIFDLRGGGRQPIKLTSKGHNTFPTWDPTGQFIAFASTAIGSRNVFRLPSDGSVLDPEQLVKSPNVQISPVWSPDMTAPVIMYSETSPATRADLWVLSLGRERTVRPWLRTEFSETEPAFSPNGKWVAFVWDRNGTAEVWILPFAGSGPPVRVSPTVGHDPVWSWSGDELFYQSGTKLMAVEIVEVGSELQPKPPRELFDGGFVPFIPGTPRTYDVAKDGRFITVEPGDGREAPSLVLVQNWFDELKRLVPTRR
jgi:serine/threonine-protein kinase